MDFLKNAALCLIAVATAGTLASVIVPRGSLNKTMRAVTGIFVVAVICSPIAEVLKTGSVQDVFAYNFEASSDMSYAEDMQKQLIEVFESTVNSSVEEIASQLNADVVSVNAELFFDDENCINIHKITVTVRNCQQYEAEYLSEKISENLGVSAEIIAE